MNLSPMRRRFLLGFLFLTAPAFADEAGLPFDPERIHRSSLDGVPRSLSIRQGERSWLGYDLERGTAFTVWTGKPGTTGLIVDGFTTRSQGETRFTDSSDGSWRLSRDGELVVTSFHYLACSDRGEAVELLWEVRHDEGAVRIRERVPHRLHESERGQVVRVLAVAGLGENGQLHLPEATAGKWTLLDAEGAETKRIDRDGTYRLILP